jgi:hypothetical protein
MSESSERTADAAEPLARGDRIGSATEAFLASSALCAAGSYGDRPEPIPSLRILAVSDREDLRGAVGR